MCRASKSIYGTHEVAKDDDGGVLLLREVGKWIGVFIISIVLIRAIPIGVIIARAVITQIVPSCIPEGFFDVSCRQVLLVRGSGCLQAEKPLNWDTEISGMSLWLASAFRVAI